MSKPRLTLITTAITRNVLHEKSIGEFYKTMGDALKQNYQLVHIINIDFPKKLRTDEKFSISQTKALMKTIIPSNVRILFIISPTADTDSPTFSNAFAKVVKAAALDARSSETPNQDLVWWMEDDWTPIRTYNYSPLCAALLCPPNVSPANAIALTLTDKAPLCSFRGGPVMNASFFNTYFNISEATVKNDPEYWVGKCIRKNYSTLVYTNHIYIIGVCILNKVQRKYEYARAIHSCYYTQKFGETEFSPGRGIRFISAFVETPESDHIYFSDVFDQADKVPQLEYPTIPRLRETLGMRHGTFDEFHQFITPCQLAHITVNPHVFKDIGRQFNAEHGVVSFVHDSNFATFEKATFEKVAQNTAK
jgi:hypothetical protein